MTDNRKAGIALIAVSVANIIIMALHPTGHQLLSAGEKFTTVVILNQVVHGLAIAAVPVSFLGTMALTAHLNAPNRLAVTGLVFYGFAMVAGILAATASGFIAPGIMKQILATEGQPVNETWKLLAAYTGGLNQAFARILATFASLAILLWSVAMVKQDQLSKPLGYYGVFSATILILLVAPGFLKLNVHGFGLVILLQSIWFISVGAILMRQGPEADPFPATA